jgi:hypothetical protein
MFKVKSYIYFQFKLSYVIFFAKNHIYKKQTYKIYPDFGEPDLFKN